MNWERIEPWDYIVVNVAAEYHKRFDMVELEDIKQDLYEWFITHPNKLTEWEAIGKKDAKNLLYRSLRNHALDYCQRWKAKSVGYDTGDLFYYEPTIVEMLLPSIIRGELTVMPILNLGKIGKPPAPSEGGNMMAMMVEINNAYHKLSKEDRAVLFLKYGESLEYKGIANELGLGSEDAARMRHNRAIKKLINRIGGYKPFLDKDAAEPSTEEPNEVIDNDYSENNYERDENTE